MRISLPFPKCPKCKTDSNNSFHKNCGGKLEIETATDNVYCTKCNDNWNIWRSVYNCSCGHEFSAHEIKKTLVEVLASCRICAEEIAARNAAQRKRITQSETSLRNFLSSFFEKLGYSFGITIGTLIETVVKSILKK